MNIQYEEVQQYYGEELSKSEDLKTNACCTLEAPAPYIQEILDQIHPKVIEKYYGCGLTIPDTIEGLTVLDLGSGSGRDCYIASALVGETGSVIGVDMTDEQLEVANSYIDYHAEKFGHANANTQFIKGNIDQLDELGIEQGSVDLIISNCVLNLCMNKAKVLQDAFDLLKPGGEMYFSDVYCDRRVPTTLQQDKVLWGECLSGALYWNDFLRMAKSAGFTDPREMKSNPITVENQELQSKLGSLKFFSVTYRLFKIDGLESDCEDYGQAISYKGSIPKFPHAMDLDAHHHFPTGKIMPVCGNSYKMLYDTRYREHFDFYGSWDTHYGIFEGCGTNMPFNSDEDSSGASCC